MDIRNERFLSTVHVPVSIAFADVERQLNTQLNGLLYEDNSLTDNNRDNFMTKVWKRGPIRIAALPDSLLHLTVPLRIWVKAGVSVLGLTTAYRETEFELDVLFKSKLDLDPDWSVHTQTQSDGYVWVRRPTVSVIGFNVPITRVVEEMLDKNLGTITQGIDQQIRREVDLRTPVLQAWNMLRQPYLISEAFRTYVQVVPRRVLITPLRFEKNAIHATIGLEGHTLTTTGSRPTVSAAVSLPDLAVVKQVPDDFRVGIISEISYPEAVRLASENVVGQTFPLPGGYSITLKAIDFYGQDDNLIIKADVAGTINGTVYLRGRPYYDAKTQTISLQHLTYDLDTRNILQRSANWLLKGTFANILEKNLTFPVGEQLADIQKKADEQLRQTQLAKGITLTGKIEKIQPDQVYLTASGMMAVVQATGRITVKVDGLQ